MYASLPRANRWWRTQWSALVCGALGIIMATLPVFTHLGSLGAWGYDTGVYLGASIRLVHGVLPYRDFALMHPPGIALLLSPASALAPLIGTSSVLVLARVLTIATMGLNCLMVARLLRSRGQLASLVGGCFLALYSDGAASDTVVMLEPFLVAFTLASLLVLTSDGAVVSGRRVTWAGVLMGIAGVIKIWAVFPFAVVTLALLWRHRSDARRFALGAGAVATVVCLPFVVAAPRAFFTDVIQSQLQRTNGDAPSTGWAYRMNDMLHMAFRPFVTIPGSGVVAAVLLALAVGTALRHRRSDLTFLDAVVVLSLVAVVASLLHASEFYPYYSYFPVTLGALAVGSLVGLVNRTVTERFPPRRGAHRRLRRGAMAVTLVTIAACFASSCLKFDRFYTTLRGLTPSGVALAAAIPQGACVTSNVAAYLLLANRFTPHTRACPAVVDPFGLWLAKAPRFPEPSPAELVPQVSEAWRTTFDRSQYVLIDPQRNFLIPWTPRLETWFHDRFRLLSSDQGLQLYVRRAA